MPRIIINAPKALALKSTAKPTAGTKAKVKKPAKKAKKA